MNPHREAEAKVQAILITAYKDYKQLKQLIELLNEVFHVYVHVDLKSNSITTQHIKELSRLKNCHVIKKYSITWGSYNHLRAILDLIRMAMRHRHLSRIHVISSQDYPIKHPRDIYDAFDGDDHNYMAVTGLKHMPDDVKDRYRYFNVLYNSDLMDARAQRINKYIISAQKKLGIRRSRLGKFTDIYKGVVWVSLTSEVCGYILKFIKAHKKFMWDMQTCFLPEEFFFQTIIMNSPYRNKVVSKNPRYSDWTERHGSLPAYLDLSDYDKIMGSGAVFARKIHPEISRALVEKIARNFRSRDRKNAC